MRRYVRVRSHQNGREEESDQVYNPPKRICENREPKRRPMVYDGAPLQVRHHCDPMLGKSRTAFNDNLLDEYEVKQDVQQHFQSLASGAEIGGLRFRRIES